MDEIQQLIDGSGAGAGSTGSHEAALFPGGSAQPPESSIPGVFNLSPEEGKQQQQQQSTTDGNDDREELAFALAKSSRAQQEGAETIEAAQRLESRNLEGRLDTPRFREALRRTGVQKNELRVKNLQEFHVNGDLPERQRMRFDHYERKRQEKLQLVLQVRQQVIQEELQKEADDSIKGLHSLQAMEQLMDREAKRLDKELRSQVRYHTAVEKENQTQLERELALRKREEYRKNRRSQAELAKDHKSQEIRAQTQARMQQKKENLILAEQESERKQATQIACQLEEEIRLREFKRRQDEENAKKSDVWNQKREQVELKNTELQMENEIRGQMVVQDYENRLKHLEAKKEEAVKTVVIRSEEQQLRLVDAQEKKARLERADEFRRVKVAKQLEEQSERIDSLMHLKENIVQQRRFRNRQSAAVRGRSMINLRKNEPGPADYGDKPSSLEGHGAKISEAKPTLALVEGSIDHAVAKAKDNPPIGTYDARVLRNGTSGWDKGGFANMQGAVPGAALKKSYLDEVQQAAKFAPGPGNYDTNKSTMQLDHATRMRRDYAPTPANEKAPVWANPDTGTPGPAAYNLDAFQRKRALQRQNQSLPALKKALE